MKTTPLNTTTEACDHMFTLGDLVMRLAAVERAPRYKNGERENDAEHSFHLALSATELAVNYYPELDAGLVTQFSLVHDLPESYTGDIWTIRISDEERVKKENAESQATKRLIKELPPYTSQLLERYEKQIEPEAKFVRFVDKLLPETVNMMAGNANSFRVDHEVHSLKEMNILQARIRQRCQSMFPEFPFINDIRDEIINRFTGSLFKK